MIARRRPRGAAAAARRAPAPRAARCGGRPRSSPPKSGYSFASVLKQCGQLATIFVTPARRRASPTFCSRHRLEDVLVAHPPRRVAGAALARPEDREVDAGRLRAASPSTARRRPRALVERRRAADPVEVLRRRVAGLEHPHAELLGPVGALRSAPAPRDSTPARRRAASARPRPGKRESTITRWRRRSTMWSTCSIETGQASHARAAGDAVPDHLSLAARPRRRRIGIAASPRRQQLARPLRRPGRAPP